MSSESKHLLICVSSFLVACSSIEFGSEAKQRGSTSTSARTATKTETAINSEVVVDEHIMTSVVPASSNQDSSLMRSKECLESEIEGAGSVQAGFGGKVYQIPSTTRKLPDFSILKPIGQIQALNLNVPVRRWTEGFPGMDTLREWFAIVFTTEFSVLRSGIYEFQTISDDGSRLYINEKLVVDNDGVHKAISRIGPEMSLPEGKHLMKIEWFQGPRDYIALQVRWRTAGDATFEPIPSELLQYVKDCDLPDFGEFD